MEYFFKNNNLTKKEDNYLCYIYESFLDIDHAELNLECILELIRDTNKIRDIINWGYSYDDDIYKYFVLSNRINNENNENSRLTLFNMIYPLVYDKDIEQAVLEINLFAFSKLRYVATDLRTMSPLDSLKSSIGRCGEQSTFLVALLRSVCIPARQCYTTRWAHTENNHAWVEVYIKGSWCYLGACEPERHLNAGWFSDPSKKSAIVLTRVPGYYNKEEIIESYKKYTEINITKHYTITKNLKIKVSKNNIPLEGILIEICIFNTGEFFPITKIITDKNGYNILNLGQSDFLLRACYKEDESLYSAFKYIRLDKDQEIELQLTTQRQNFSFIFKPPKPSNSELKRDHYIMNKELFDSKIKMYENIYNFNKINFKTDYYTNKLLSLYPELKRDKIFKFIDYAKGNSKILFEIIKDLYPIYEDTLFLLLNSLKEKDFVSLTFDLIHEFLYEALIYKDKKEFALILNPKIDYEFIKKYKAIFNREIPNFLNISELINFVKDKIELIEQNSYFYYRSAMHPLATWYFKKADLISYKVFLVALARTKGFGAKINNKTMQVEFEYEDGFKEYHFKINEILENKKGNLTIINNEKSKNLQLTIQKYDKTYSSMGYLKEDIEKFNKEIFNVGNYILTSGIRENEIAKGKCYFFDIKENQETIIIIEEIEKINKKEINIKEYKKEFKNKYILILDIEKFDEPTYHIINELNNTKLKDTDLVIYSLLDKAKIDTYFKDFKNIAYNLDEYDNLIKLKEELNLNDDYPKLLLLSFKKVLYVSQGYKRGSITEIEVLLN